MRKTSIMMVLLLVTALGVSTAALPCPERGLDRPFRTRRNGDRVPGEGQGDGQGAGTSSPGAQAGAVDRSSASGGGTVVVGSR